MLNISYKSQHKGSLFLPNITSRLGQENKFGIFEQTFMSKTKAHGYRNSPLFLDTSLDVYRKTPSPSRLGNYKAVESIIDSGKMRKFRNKSNKSRNVSQKLTSFKVAQRRLNRAPVKFMITMMKINSNYKEGSGEEIVKDKLEFGCQIDVEKET
ncbi:hypothetical protein SteCoe_7217 [Stentor coeruleus]|uniref:Uncharacterized protein n=1 Tax=Stentor coeruleus TaxID=5963 RepID=A0A1R2CN19_9CILI|nr:hypothetical protein SteCoe_7217 [Stentor coeruleus]